jgi:Cytochrome P450
MTFFQSNQILFALACVSALGLGAVVIDYVRILLLRRKLPPGPFPLPIVGNVLQLPERKPWIAFEKWSQRYGDPLLTVWIGRVPSIFVNDAWAASDLMEKRANIYSGRPRHVVLGDLLGNTNSNQTLLGYNDRWRIHRKLTVSPYLSVLMTAYECWFSSGS